MSKTKIEWTQHTWNPTVGCTIVSPGCTNCYAMNLAYRVECINAEAAAKYKSEPSPQYNGTTKRVNGRSVWTGRVAFSEKALDIPLRRRVPTTYFVNSMSDLFHEDVPDEWIDKVFAVMALTPHHTYQVLTKRSARMRAYFKRFDSPLADSLGSKNPYPLPNVWLGVSTERQKEADERIPDLLATPAAVRFISAEPLLGPIDFGRWMRSRDVDQDGRGVRLSSSPVGRVEHRRSRSGVETGSAPLVALGESDGDHPLPAEASGTRCRKVLTGACNARPSSRLGSCATSGMASLQRADPARHDNQPQGRREEEERTRQPGASDDFRTGNPRDSSSRVEAGSQLSWIIVGGESGPGARPMHPDWARSIRDQCKDAGVPFFFKQIGSWYPTIDRDKEDPDWRADYTRANHQPDKFRILNLAGGCGFHGERVHLMKRYSKSASGRLLDGREHNGMPEAGR